MRSIIPTSIARMDRIGFTEYAREHGVPATLRILLVSDGSLTRLLRGWSLDDVSLESLCMDEWPADEESARWLDTPVGTTVYHREVWLTANGNRLVYASSDWYLPNAETEMSTLATRFISDLKTSPVPIGDVIRRRGLWSKQELLEIGLYSSEELSRQWGGDRFWGRRYLMRVEGIVCGTILEIFSPRLGEAS